MTSYVIIQILQCLNLPARIITLYSVFCLRTLISLLLNSMSLLNNKYMFSSSIELGLKLADNQIFFSFLCSHIFGTLTFLKVFCKVVKGSNLALKGLTGNDFRLGCKWVRFSCSLSEPQRQPRRWGYLVISWRQGISSSLH